MASYLLVIVALVCADVALAGKHGMGGDMMRPPMMMKKMGGGGAPMLTWNINLGGGGGMAKKKAFMVIGMMHKMMIGMHDMTKPYCKEKCMADTDDCPSEDSDMKDRSNLCRTCMLECMTCKNAGMVTKMKNKMEMKKKMMREGKMMMPSLDDMLNPHMMMKMMSKKDENGKTMMEAALDTMKGNQMSLMNMLGMPCDKFWPTEEEMEMMGPKFMKMMMGMSMDDDKMMDEN